MNKRALLQPLLAILVLGAGVGVLVALKRTKPEVPRETEATEAGTLVEVLRVEARRHEVAIRAQGTVVPAKQVVLSSEISGRVVWQHDELAPGGHLRRGAVVLRIDPRDYELELESRRAEVSRAELELKVERSKQRVAQLEWRKFQTAQSAQPDGESLALRKPQVQTAEVAVASAESALEQAQRELDKTVLSSPFNALVVSEDIDEGQIVSPQAELATLVDTDRFWVRVSIPVEGLSKIHIPGRNGAKHGAPARVWTEVGDQRVEREGRVLRILPDLDPDGTMARVLVGVEDPLALEAGEGAQKLPLLLNSYVNVEIVAPALEDAIAVPRVALRDGDQVYVMDADECLRIREVSVLWRRPESVLVGRGLRSGDNLVISRVPAPTEGMKLRLESRTVEQIYTESLEPRGTTRRGDDGVRVEAASEGASARTPGPESDRASNEQTL